MFIYNITQKKKKRKNIFFLLIKYTKFIAKTLVYTINLHFDFVKRFFFLHHIFGVFGTTLFYKNVKSQNKKQRNILVLPQLEQVDFVIFYLHFAYILLNILFTKCTQNVPKCKQKVVFFLKKKQRTTDLMLNILRTFCKQNVQQNVELLKSSKMQTIGKSSDGSKINCPSAPWLHFAAQNVTIVRRTIDLGSTTTNPQSFYGRITVLPQLREAPWFTRKTVQSTINY